MDPRIELSDALALAAIGPAKDADLDTWILTANAMRKHRKGAETVFEAALRIVADSQKWNAKRVTMLTHEQRRMRDPERTLVCDIIANGQLLPDPDGTRYGPLPHAP